MNVSTRSPTLRAETAAILERIDQRAYRVGIVGLGYVGIPLMLAAARAGFSVIGFDIDVDREAQLGNGVSSIKHIPSAAIAEPSKAGGSNDVDSPYREVEAIYPAADPRRAIASRPVVRREYRAGDAPSASQRPPGPLESSPIPGTTDEVLKLFSKRPADNRRGLFPGVLAGREDPGNQDCAPPRSRSGGADGPMRWRSQCLYTVRWTRPFRFVVGDRRGVKLTRTSSVR